MSPAFKTKKTLKKIGSSGKLILDTLVSAGSIVGGTSMSAVCTIVPSSNGAIDVLCVRDVSNDEHFMRATPFFVRFGNARSLFKIGECEVFVEVNAVMSSFKMRLSRNGQCSFTHENEEFDENGTEIGGARKFDGWDLDERGEALDSRESAAIDEAERAGFSGDDGDDEDEDGSSSVVEVIEKSESSDKERASASSKAKKWFKNAFAASRKTKTTTTTMKTRTTTTVTTTMTTSTEKDAVSDSTAAKVKKAQTKRKRNTRLTNEELKTLDLKPGVNRISYSYTSNLFGTQKVECNLYLWDSDDKVVISDVDGTITKSDVLGHVYGWIGKDWVHKGIAALYNAITNNGYKIVFVTSRAISQSDSTRSYLQQLTQNGTTLPLGPVMCAPDPVATALYREVVARRPEVFKISCLTRVRRLFDTDIKNTRMYAGFGNRSSDVLAYKSCGVDLEKIYTIDPKSMLRCEKTGESFEIQHLLENVNVLFPPIEGRAFIKCEQDAAVNAQWKVDESSPSTVSSKKAEQRLKCLLTAEEKSGIVRCSLFLDR